MEFRSQRKLCRCKLKDRKFTFCDFTAFFYGCIIFRTDNVKFFCITVLLLFSPFLRQNKRDGPQRQSN